MIKIHFDKETCTRCGGSGQFSYNPMDGTLCYGCRSRTGQKLTKAGRKAFEAFEAALKIPQEELTIGDMVWIRLSSTTVRRTVVSFGPVQHIGSQTINGVYAENYGRKVTFTKDLSATYHNGEMVQLCFSDKTVTRVLAALGGMKGYAIENLEV